MGLHRAEPRPREQPALPRRRATTTTAPSTRRPAADARSAQAPRAPARAAARRSSRSTPAASRTRRRRFRERRASDSGRRRSERRASAGSDGGASSSGPRPEAGAPRSGSRPHTQCATDAEQDGASIERGTTASTNAPTERVLRRERGWDGSYDRVADAAGHRRPAELRTDAAIERRGEHALAAALVELLAANPAAIERLVDLLEDRGPSAREPTTAVYTVASLAEAIDVSPKVVRGAIAGASSRGQARRALDHLGRGRRRGRSRRAAAARRPTPGRTRAAVRSRPRSRSRRGRVRRRRL